MGANDVLLGDGVFNINGVDVALTRGGGKFVVEREYKEIEADGDMGPVKGRIRKIKAVAKLSMSILEILTTNIPKFYPALTLSSDATKDTITPGQDIQDSDYQNVVTWTGRTKAGKPVIITIYNAINLENIEWELKDKDEIVPELNYTATYAEGARTAEPWKLDFIKNSDPLPPVATLIAPQAGSKTQLVVMFNEPLDPAVFNITDRFNLLSSLTNDGVAISIATQASSVVWYNNGTPTPMAIITIPATTFVAGKLVRLNFKANTVKDTAGNYIAATTNVDSVVVA